MEWKGILGFRHHITHPTTKQLAYLYMDDIDYYSSWDLGVI